MAQAKILCCGDVNGKFELLIKKTELINKKVFLFAYIFTFIYRMAHLIC